MKKFVQFYQPSTGYVAGSIPPRFDGPKELIPACGSNSVLPLDARFSQGAMIERVREMARKRGFPAFQIMRGSKFSESNPCSPIFFI